MAWYRIIRQEAIIQTFLTKFDDAICDTRPKLVTSLAQITVKSLI